MEEAREPCVRPSNPCTSGRRKACALWDVHPPPRSGHLGVGPPRVAVRALSGSCDPRHMSIEHVRNFARTCRPWSPCFWQVMRPARTGPIRTVDTATGTRRGTGRQRHASPASDIAFVDARGETPAPPVPGGFAAGRTGDPYPYVPGSGPSGIAGADASGTQFPRSRSVHRPDARPESAGRATGRARRPGGQRCARSCSAARSRSRPRRRVPNCWGGRCSHHRIGDQDPRGQHRTPGASARGDSLPPGVTGTPSHRSAVTAAGHSRSPLPHFGARGPGFVGGCSSGAR
ncbi:MAG: hypothetical protein JWO79_1881 [Actinomycetia bacterium]|nr:hypothetical protein [Actinomycetes bacterium]